MPPRPARVTPAELPELSHRDIIKAVDGLRSHVDLGFREVNARADERHRATCDRFDRIEERLDGHTRAIGKLEGAPSCDVPHTTMAGGTPPEDPEHGLPFKKGWPRNLAIGGIVITSLAALKLALLTIDWLCGGLAAFWHTLTNTPH